MSTFLNTCTRTALFTRRCLGELQGDVLKEKKGEKKELLQHLTIS